MRILIVEDNVRLAALMLEGLRHHGFSCDLAHDLDTADSAVRTVDYDAILLDLGLPDGDGLDWLRSFRQDGTRPPALVVTARGALEDRVSGLDAGADDYLVKPFEMEELAARIRAMLRRPGGRAPAMLQTGALSFDLATRSVRLGDQLLDLSRREAALLELLMRRAGSVVQRETIEASLYSFNEPVTPNAVEAVVSRLRRKLEDAGAGGLLHTVRGVGYLMQDKG